MYVGHTLKFALNCDFQVRHYWPIESVSSLAETNGILSPRTFPNRQLSEIFIPCCLSERTGEANLEGSKRRTQGHQSSKPAMVNLPNSGASSAFITPGVGILQQHYGEIHCKQCGMPGCDLEVLDCGCFLHAVSGTVVDGKVHSMEQYAHFMVSIYSNLLLAPYSVVHRSHPISNSQFAHLVGRE